VIFGPDHDKFLEPEGLLIDTGAAWEDEERG